MQVAQITLIHLHIGKQRPLFEISLIVPSHEFYKTKKIFTFLQQAEAKAVQAQQTCEPI